MTATTPRQGDWIQTYTLRQFWPLDPRPEDVCLTDIAHALSMQCRFSGHVSDFYSVAEHSVRVSLLAESTVREWVPGSAGEAAAIMVARWGLFHDASEAYLVDVPRPVKHQPELAAYREAEARVQQAVCAHFGLGAFEPEAVKRADKRLCFTEARDLFRGLHPAWVNGAEPLPERIHPWTHREAEARFLERFHQLWPGGAP